MKQLKENIILIILSFLFAIIIWIYAQIDMEKEYTYRTIIEEDYNNDE